MTPFTGSTVTIDEFLTEYWQKKPLLFRQAFPGFEPILDADDIAGLACDELAESRLISGRFSDKEWTIRYGPFEEGDFKSLPDMYWTLLVQDVEKHYPPLRDLMDHFRFLPSWRVDDLMVSVAAPGGSVGPHVDQYDVFLLQAQGSRNWQIAEKYEPELLAGCELNVLCSFEADSEWTLEAGDILYLPPGVAHHGVAQDQCMTWSIGMRGRSSADLFQSLGEWLAVQRNEGERYRDTNLAAAASAAEIDAGEIDAGAIEGFRRLVNSFASEPSDFPEFLGSFLSCYRLAHQPAPPDKLHDPEHLNQALRSGSILLHNPWTQLLWIRKGPSALLFATGTMYSCSIESARIICDPNRLESVNGETQEPDPELICQLLNLGHLLLD
jgi:50S ribosomal protein L16 3-hydroxylase